MTQEILDSHLRSLGRFGIKEPKVFLDVEVYDDKSKPDILRIFVNGKYQYYQYLELKNTDTQESQSNG